MNTSNPPIMPTESFKENNLPIQMKPPATQTNQKAIMQAVWKLVKNKPASYQIRDDELLKCGVGTEKCDSVRQAVSRASAAGQNFVFGFFGWLFGQVGNFIDTIFKVVLMIFIFLLSLQLPYLNDQANQKLNGLISESEFNYQKYDIATKQLTQNLALMGYKLDKAKLDKAIPQQMKTDRELAKAWMQYKGQTVEGIWASVPKNWSTAQPKLKTLSSIYRETLKTYKPGLPMGKQSYVNAALVCLLVLIGYLILQSLTGIAIRNKFRQVALHRELKKALR
jgi:uncharacterized membrane protein YciS (DUF1049 family)